LSNQLRWRRDIARRDAQSRRRGDGAQRVRNIRRAVTCRAGTMPPLDVVVQDRNSCVCVTNNDVGFRLW
jgi:hypothetical protein